MAGAPSVESSGKVPARGELIPQPHGGAVKHGNEVCYLPIPGPGYTKKAREAKKQAEGLQAEIDRQTHEHRCQIIGAQVLKALDGNLDAAKWLADRHIGPVATKFELVLDNAQVVNLALNLALRLLERLHPEAIPLAPAELESVLKDPVIVMELASNNVYVVQRDPDAVEPLDSAPQG